jgi:hypothetical protein
MFAFTEIKHDLTPATETSPLALAVLAAGLSPGCTRRILDRLLAKHTKVTITELHGERLKFDKLPDWPVWGKATRIVITVYGVVIGETKWDRSAPEFSGYYEQNGTRIRLEGARGVQACYI